MPRPSASTPRRWLDQHAGRLAQLAWLALALVLLGVILAGLPYRDAELRVICRTDRCIPGQVRTETVAMLERLGERMDAAAMGRSAFSTIAYDAITNGVIFALAVVLIWQKPRNPAAAVTAFVFAGLAAMLTGTPDALGRAVAGYAIPARLLNALVPIGLFVAFGILPDGRFRQPWLRWLAMPYAVAAMYFVIWRGDTLDMPVGPDNIGWAGVNAVAGVTMLASLVLRYRASATVVERQQFKWIIAGAAIAISWLALKHAIFLLAPSGSRALFAGTASVPDIVTGTSFAGCIAVAILQFQLFDIDIALNRGLVYGTLTVLVVAAYAMIATGLGAALAQLAPADNPALAALIPLVTTCLIVMAFEPLRERVQRAINRMMYGQRDEPQRALAQLGQRLEAAFEPDAILPAIVQTIGESLKLPRVELAVREAGGMRVAAVHGVSPLNPSWRAVGLSYQGQVIGELRACAREGEDALSAADERVLVELAKQASAAVHGVRVMDDLRRSRERLVLAREEERRRLRRDLHDDLAPTLAGLSFTAITIADLVRSDPDKAAKLAQELGAQTRGVVGGIRELVYDLRPPALDDLGLLAAIRDRAAQFGTRDLAVAVDAPDTLPPLPAAVEVAAYRILQEALMNVAKHAHARHCDIRLWLTEAPRALRMEVTDDGIGFPKHVKSGVGLSSIEERAAELGGTCDIGDVASGGTRVSVLLPLASA